MKGIFLIQETIRELSFNTVSNYQIIQPCVQLRPFIETFWLQENPSRIQNCPPTTVLPTTTMDLVFNFADPFVQLNNDGTAEQLPFIYLSGQKTKYVKVTATGRTGMIIVRFYPWGAAPFFDFPIDELTNASIDLHQLTNQPAVNELEARTKESSTATERIAFIESFLFSLLNGNSCDSLVFESIRRINHANGNICIRDLARQLNLSRRQFQRRFAQVVGATPKEFAGIIRFQKALFRTANGSKWPEIISECGFYDQAHLIRDMKKYSGLSHQKILSTNAVTSLMKQFNTKHKMSHLYNTTYL